MKKIIVLIFLIIISSVIYAESVLKIYTKTAIANRITPDDYPDAIKTVVGASSYEWTADRKGVTVTAIVKSTTPIANGIYAMATQFYPQVKIVQFSVIPTATRTPSITPTITPTVVK